jgi:hypothetical protein
MDYFTSVDHNADDAKLFISTNKGQAIVITLGDGTEVEGLALSVNSKGVNITVDGKTKSISMARVSRMELGLTAADMADGIAEIEADDAWMDEDTEADYIADMKESGEVDLTDVDTDDTANVFTTAEVAARFAMTAKELRVQLRAWGMGVGQGRTYGLTSADLVTIQTKLAEKAEQA